MSRNKKPWIVKSSKELLKSGFFRLRCDELELPDGRIQPRYYTMEFSDWVNVVAVKEDGDLILIRQYRPPVESVCVEIPGGAIDPRFDQTPEQGALRELLEETNLSA